MRISPDILSLDPAKVDEALLDFFDKACPNADEVKRALMHRIANFIFIANQNKDEKAKSVDGLSQLIAKISASDSSIEEKTSQLAQSLGEHILTPAYTAHPTNPKSPEVDEAMVNIYNLAMLLRNEKAADLKEMSQGEREQRDKRKMPTIIQKLQQLSSAFEIPSNLNKKGLLSSVESELIERMEEFASAELTLQRNANLTVEEEVERNLQNLKTLFDEFNKTKHRIIEEFCKANNITDLRQKERVAEILTPAISKQFQPHSWAGSDADGNKQVTYKTESNALRAGEDFIINLHLKNVNELLKRFNEASHPQIFAVLDQIKTELTTVRLEEAAEASAAAEDHSVEAKARATKTAEDNRKIVARLDSIIVESQISDPEEKRALVDLKDQFDCFGFVALKMDVRQSSVENVEAMQQILQFLKAKQPEVERRFPGNYSDGNFPQESFTDYLKELEVMTLISENIDELGPVAQSEIKRMIVAKVRFENFERYIISDTKGPQNRREVVALEKLAKHYLWLKDELPEKCADFRVFYLCETSEDLRGLPEMTREAIKDEKSVKQLDGEYHIFLGPSDSEKRSGLAALILMEILVEECIDIIEEHNKKNKEFPLKVKFFQAQGNDVFRGGSRLREITTDQGQGAQDYLFKQYFKQRLRNIAGVGDDFMAQIKQIKDLGQENPLAKKALIDFMVQSIESFEAFVSHNDEQKNGDKLAKFLTKVSVSDALGKTNKSSRAKAKGAASEALNLDKERAIGLATRFSACGIEANITYGMSIPLSEEIRQHLPLIFERATIVQESVYKTLYTVARGDWGRFGKALAINGAALDGEDLKMMETIKKSTFQALKNCVCFLPIDSEERRTEILKMIDESREKDFFPNEVAKQVMSQVGAEFPVIKELLNNAEMNSQHYGATINGILDKFVDPSIDEGKKELLNSQLAVLYREEMRVPEVINTLTTKTPVKSKSSGITPEQFSAAKAPASQQLIP